MSFINARIRGTGCNPAEYHTQLEGVERGDPNFIISPSSLKAFFQCPSRWRHGYESPESKAKDFGSLLDCCLLTPDQFPKRYAIAPATYQAEPKKKGEPMETKPWNNNATLCKEWNAEQHAAGREVVKADDVLEVKDAIARLTGDPVIAPWLAACDSQVWVEGQWQDEATGLFIPVRCLLDFVPRADSEFSSSLGDCKTTTNGGLREFERQAIGLGYHVQAGFDLDLFNAATGEDRTGWTLLGVENYPPYEPIRRILDPHLLELGADEYRRALKVYCHCLKTQVFPGYDDHRDATQGYSVLTAPPWLEYASASDKLSSLVEAELSTEEKLDAAFGK